MGETRTVAGSLFRSARGEAEYLASYEASLRHWRVPYEEADLDSRFGSTHVLISGPRDAPPLVLLHGYGASSTMWAPNIPDLARRHRVFAVDVITQPGKSRPRAVLATRADCVAWLTSVLDGLGIDRARLVGQSYGGWLTLNYAIAEPERLRAVALISPGGLLPLSRQLALRGMLAYLLPLQLCSDLVLMRWISTHHPLADDEQKAFAKRLSRQMCLGLRIRSEPMRRAAPATPFSDDDLRSLRVPLLLLIGTEEVLYDPAAALERARRLVPDFAGELVPHASHDLVSRYPAIVDARLNAFFAAVDERPCETYHRTA
jgi:pimeloyl-ACP methyl ester carboxylesterase